MNIDTQIKDFIRDYAQYKEALKKEARMSDIEEQLTKAHGHVRQAKIIMEKLGHEKYSLSGMCSAAMRHDLEQEVSKLLRELDEAKQKEAMLINNQQPTPSPSTPNQSPKIMNQNQTESKPPSVEEPRDKGLDETTCSRLSDWLPPSEIVDAAEKVRVWMEMNGHINWQLGGICDQRIAADRDEWRDVANGSLLGTAKQLDTALDALKVISVADWKTSGELRKMARDAYSSANNQ